MDEPMDVDNVNVPFATKSSQSPQQHLEDLQSNKENAVNPNIFYEDLDVSEMDMRLRMSMSHTPMASSAIKVDSRRNIGLSSSVINEQLNNLNARYMDVSNISVSNESCDVSMSDMSVDDADSTLVLNYSTETAGNININNTIHSQKDNHIESEMPQPPVQTKEPLKVMSDEANRSNASLHVNTGNKNIPGTNMNESSPIIRGLRSVINMFRPSQSPISLSPSPLVDDNTISILDSSKASPITPHNITISDDNELEIKRASIADRSQISSSSSPQICHVKKQYKKEDVENKSSTSEGVVFQEEFINDLQWNDDSTIIFNTRRSTQNVRFSSSLSESPCDSDAASRSFTNLSTELSGENIHKVRSSNNTEKHPIVEESSTNNMQNIELESNDFSNESVEREENIFGATRPVCVDQDTINAISVTDSKSFNETTDTQNATILVKPNTAVNLGNDETIEKSYSLQNTTIELESHKNISLNVTALSNSVNIEDSNDTENVVTEPDELTMTLNQQNLSVENSPDLMCRINCSDVCNAISNDAKSIVEAIEFSTFSIEQCGFTKQTKLDDKVEADFEVEVLNNSQNLDQSIYKFANSEHQESIVDAEVTLNTNNNITSLEKSDMHVSAESNKFHEVSENEAEDVLQKACPIGTEIEASKIVEIPELDKTGWQSMLTNSNQEQLVDTQIIKEPVEIYKTTQKSKQNEKESTSSDFYNVENALATIIRVGTSPEKYSSSEIIELDEVQTVRSDSAITIKNASLDISEDIVQEPHETSTSLHTSDETLLQAKNAVLNHSQPTQVTPQSTVTQDVLQSTVDEQYTSDIIVDTTEIHMDDIENPFVTKTKIRESFSPSKECTDEVNPQLDSFDGTCTSKMEVQVPFEETTNEECARFENLNKKYTRNTNVGESASPSKECIDAIENHIESTKKQIDSNPKTGESKKITTGSKDASKTHFEGGDNLFIPKIEKCNSTARPTEEQTNVRDKFINSTKYLTQNSEIEDSVNMCKKGTEPGEIQIENIENPFITKTKIRDSASPSKEYTDVKDDFVDHTINTFSSAEIVDANENQFDIIENPFVTKTRIRNSASPSHESENVEENLLKCTENPFVTKSRIRESPISSYDGSDAVAKHLDIKKPFVEMELTTSDPVNSNRERKKFNYMDNSFDTKSNIQDKLSSTENYINQIKLAGNPAAKDTVEVDFLNDPFNTIGVMQRGYFSCTNEEMMEMDRSIEEEFQPGELFADPDAFDYFMSRTNKNEVLEKGKESLFLKFDPLYSGTTNSEGVVSSLAKLAKNRLSINQNPDNTITIDPSDDNIGETTMMDNTGVATIEINPTISVSDSTFLAYHDPSEVDDSVISYELNNRTLETKKNDSTTNSACDEKTNSSDTIQMAIRPNTIVDALDNELNKTILVSSGNQSAITPQNGLESEKKNAPITLDVSNQSKKALKIIAVRSPNRSTFSKTSSYAQAADINKQTAQNTFAVPQDSEGIIDNTITMQHSFNNTFDKLTSSVTEKPTLMVSPAINSEKVNTPSRSTPLSTARENVANAVSPAMAVINRLIFERSPPSTSNSDDATRVNVENNTADTVLCEIASSHYQIGHDDQHDQLQQQNRLMLNKIAEYELKLKNVMEENSDKVEKIDRLQKKLTEKSSENKKMANVMEDYERTISLLITEREAEKSKQVEERRELRRELDEQTAHLASMEYSFNDLHTKYEKSKIIVKGYRANEEALKKTMADNEVNFRKLEANYNLLQQHATAKLSAANEELDKIKKHHDAEILKLNALVKRKEMLASSLQESLIQEKKNNEQLTAICDELINKVG